MYEYSAPSLRMLRLVLLTLALSHAMLALPPIADQEDELDREIELLERALMELERESSSPSGEELIIVGKETQQSSDWRPRYSSDKAADGNSNSDFSKGSCTATKWGANPWWKVSLGGRHCIRKISVVNRGEKASKRLANAIAKARTVSDGEEVDAVCGSPVTTEQAAVRGGTVTFECDPPLEAQDVIVTIPSERALLQLCEVRLWEVPLDECQAPADTDSAACFDSLCGDGTCVSKPDGSPYCQCPEGTEGENCEKDIRTVCDLEPDRYIFDRKEGYLQSPGYPEAYGYQERCPYFIGAPDAKKIELTFLDVDIQPSGDAVFLCYGPGASFDFDNSECIEALPAEPIQLAGDRAWLYFQTSSTNPDKRRGFRLSYRIDGDECLTDPCMEGETCTDGEYTRTCEGGEEATCSGDPCGDGQCVSKPDGSPYCQCPEGKEGENCEKEIQTFCDLEPDRYIFDRKEGYLQSPGYPEVYAYRQRCPYFIGAPDAKKIELTFQDIDIQSQSEGVSLCYGTGASVDFDKQECLDVLPAEPIELIGDRAWIFFQTTYGNPENKRGFKLNFRIDGDECLANPCKEGETCIDREYTHTCEGAEDAACSGNPCGDGRCVSKPDGSPYCQCPEGTQGESCEKEMPTLLATVCDLEPNRYIFDRTEGYLQSPGYPEAYPLDQRCPYFIGIADAKRIELTFLDVDVQPQDDGVILCYGTGASFDFENAECIESLPAEPIELVGDRAWVYFHTTSTNPDKKRGFKLSFRIDGDECLPKPCDDGLTCVDERYTYVCKDWGPGLGDLKEINVVGKDASQSSFFASGYDSSKAVDGNPDTCSRTGTQERPYWSVALDGTHCVSKVSMVNSGDESVTGSPLTDAFLVALSENGRTVCRPSASEAQEGGGEVIISCDPPSEAAGLLITIDYDDAAIKLCEVRVWELPLDKCGIQSDIDECSSDPCLNGATCVDGSDEFSCTCPADFTGPLCENNIDECASNPCQNGVCKDGVDGFTCECSPGYEGAMCENDIDECNSDPCLNGATCVDGNNAFSCTCPASYTGSLCEHNAVPTDIGECDGQPCHYGECVDDGSGGSTCQCSPGYEGDACDINIDECSSDPCQNGGQCVDGVDEFSCFCAVGFTGHHCEINYDECCSNPCQNGAECVDGIYSYVCNCAAGFTGVNCEEDIDDCDSDPCQNGASCVDGVDEFSCTCVAGYGGTLCETNINECSSAPCRNAGDCQDGVNGFFCLCADGFGGFVCENDINECASSPCPNGICIDEWNGFTCACAPGYEGTFCEINIDECLSDPCRNGGTCEDGSNEVICKCATGFTGLLCELHQPKGLTEELTALTHILKEVESSPWRVNLTGEYCITKVVILSRKDCRLESMTGAVVRAGTDTSMTENSVCGSPVTASEGEERRASVIFVCDPPLTANYISVDVPSKGPVKQREQYCEVTIERATPGPCNAAP